MFQVMFNLFPKYFDVESRGFYQINIKIGRIKITSDFFMSDPSHLKSDENLRTKKIILI